MQQALIHWSVFFIASNVYRAAYTSCVKLLLHFNYSDMWFHRKGCYPLIVNIAEECFDFILVTNTIANINIDKTKYANYVGLDNTVRWMYTYAFLFTFLNGLTLYHP